MLRLGDLYQFMVNHYAVPYLMGIALLVVIPVVLPLREEDREKKRKHLPSNESVESSTSTEAPEEEEEACK